MLRAAVFLSIAGVIQHSQQTFLFCHDGYTDPDIWMDVSSSASSSSTY